MSYQDKFRREYMGEWHRDDTLRIDLGRIKSLVDVDKLRGQRPKRIVFDGVSRNPLDPVMRYLAQILDTMVADGAVVVDDDGPEGIHVIIHDVPEGMTAEKLVHSVAALRPTSVMVDTACGGTVVLDYLRQFGISAAAIPKRIR